MFACLPVNLRPIMHAFLLYIDPGSGSLLLQFIMGAFLAIAVFFKTIRYKIMSIFGRKKDETEEE